LAAARQVGRPADLPKLIEGFLADGERLIVVAGGDGTINTAVNALAGSDAVLGILARGTANSFARGLGLPLELPAAVQALAGGKVIRADVGNVDGKRFANSMAIGLSPAISRFQPHRLKRIAGRAGYVIVAAILLPRFRVFACTIETESGERHTFRKASAVRVTNGPYRGGVKASPEADVTSGELVCYVTPGASKWRLIKSWIELILGRPARETEVECFQIRQAVIETSPRQYVSLDGDARMKTPVRVGVEPGALRVIAPR
ncbi:MAG TPA: diacylglycerol kinase family protein, partial [Pseudolabrys sp.]|nr:diacylglycerol kinase family protein [Pseudolabrys sp.]